MASVVIGVYVLTKSITTKSITIKLQNKFLLEKESLIDEAIKKYKADDGHNAILDNEYKKGRVDGAKEELEKFSVTYQPFFERIDGLVWDDAVIGYEMQMNYAGFPIGDPTRRITNRESKFKEELVMKILNSEVASLINEMAKAYNSKGISTKVISSPKKTKIKS